MVSTYKSLFIDLDDTLLDFRSSQESAIKATFQAVGLDIFPAIIAHYERINRSLWKQFEQGSMTKEGVFHGRWELLLRQYGISRESRAVNRVYMNELAENPIWLDGAEDFLTRLSAVYQIVIVSNGDGKTARRRMDLLGITKLVGAIIISEEVGAAKPNSLIFQRAMAKAAVTSKDQLLMIGDNYHADICGAHNFSIDACWYNPSKGIQPAGKKPLFESASHQEIVEWLLKGESPGT